MEKARILVVEDETIVAMDIANTLQNLGHEVTDVVPSGKRAIASVKENRPDLILMDIGLKGEMDGIQTAEQIRSQYSIPVIFLTAYADEKTLERAKITAPCGYLIKPFEETDLRIAVEVGLYRAKLESKREALIKELYEARDKYLNLYDFAPTGYFTLDHNSLILDVNLAGSELLGSEKHRLIGAQFTSSIPPDSQDAVHLHYREVFKTSIKVSCELKMLKADGTSFHAQLISMAIPEKDGDKSHYKTAVIDITERKSSEMELEKLAKFPSENPNPVIRVDNKDVILYANVSAKPILKLWDKKQGDKLSGKWLLLVKKVIKAGKADVSEAEYQDKIYSLTFNPIEGTDYLNIYGRNITTQKRAEEKLKITEQNLRNSLDNSPLGIRIITENGNLLYANQAILEIYGYSGVKDLETTPVKERYTPVSYAEHQKRKGLRKQGKPVPPNYEISIVRKNGEIRHLAVSRKEVTWNGKIQFQAVYQDITEHKQTQIKLEQAAKKWQTTFDSIGDRISIHDKDFRLVMVNKAFADAFHKTPGDFVGKYCYEIMHGTNSPIANCPFEKTLETSLPGFIEMFEPHLGIWVQISTAPIFDEKGKVTAVVHTTRDVSEQKKMQEQLMAQDRLASIGQLVSGVAHEINNPLTSVIGFSELLLKRDLSDDVKADLKVVNDEAMRTAKIVKNLLTFARKQPEGKAPVDINENIRKVLDLRDHEQKVNNIGVITHLASDLPRVMGNASQLQQVFFNIVINAEFFMQEAHQKGTLTITTERTGDFLRASFTDDGPGISEEHMKNLFIPFFTTKEVGKGTGLGLGICYGIISEHGGRIYAESDPGKGATFVVELPIHKATTSQEVAE